MAEDSNDGAPIPIEEVDRHSFEIVLQWIYTVMDLDQMEEIWNDCSNVEKLLFAADRCECTDLKLYAESVVADKFLTIENAANLLVIADGHSCALLKEAAMNVYADHSLAVEESDGWFLVEPSNQLLNELLDYDIQPIQDGEEFECMCVSDLRRRLEKADLDLDGSRKTLIGRLQEHAGYAVEE